ncbi:MAG: SDR family NAD(P)-dependent oxidoreductase, partial [Chloroflexota bacterium]
MAIVTGGASGIGLGIGTRIAQEGGTVVLVDLSADALTEAVAKIRDVPGHVVTSVADITAEDDVEQLMRSAVEDYGQLDVVVNSAGIAGPTATNITDYDTDAFRRVIDVNLIGSFIVTKHAVAMMKPRGYGRILLLASIAGKDGNPGMAGYTTSKAGVIGLVKGIGKEYADTQLTINGLAPAVIATPMNLKTAAEQLEYMKSKIPMGRLGTVDEVASLACWIVSAE